MRFIPHKTPHLGEEPFFIRKGPVGCLLIHGFCGTPSEMKYLGEYLSARDITVRGLMLPGHGTTPDEMLKTGWRDWTAAAERELVELRGQCEEVFVAGLSMGGALTLYLASKYELPGAACLAGAVNIRDWRVRYLLPALGWLVRYYPRDSKTDFADPEAEKKHRTYEYVPVKCVRSLLELVDIARNSLSKIKCPLLVMHSPSDQTLTIDNAEYIFEHAASEKKEYVKLNRSGHVITSDIERDIVGEKVYELIKRESKLLGGSQS